MPHILHPSCLEASQNQRGPTGAPVLLPGAQEAPTAWAASSTSAGSPDPATPPYSDPAGPPRRASLGVTPWGGSSLQGPSQLSRGLARGGARGEWQERSGPTGASWEQGRVYGCGNGRRTRGQEAGGGDGAAGTRREPTDLHARTAVAAPLCRGPRAAESLSVTSAVDDREVGTGILLSSLSPGASGA